jgi:tetratricopeptide (TPR) repeat protein
MRSDHHTTDDREHLDAKRVDEALGCLQARNTSTAYRLLSDVIANAPHDYVYQYEQDGTLHMKFWSPEEFLHYTTWQSEHGDDRSIVWIESAYPRAYYYLAFLKVEAEEYESAIELLEKGQYLEPGNIRFTLEKAQVYFRMGHHQEALDLFDNVQAPGPHVSGGDVAKALRGKGVVLIDLGDLDLAEQNLRQSLRYDPTSQMAIGELEYIQHLRAGGESVGAGVFRTSGVELTRCVNCGENVQEGLVGNIEGNVVMLCKRCHRKLTKRWWEFWK